MALRKKVGWRKALIFESAINFCLAAALCPLSVGAAWAYMTIMWALLPAIGALTAYMAARNGLNCYVTWFVPVVLSVSAHWIIIGYPPSSAGMALLNAGLCLVASAAAQVKNERDDRKSKERAQ